MTIDWIRTAQTPNTCKIQRITLKDNRATLTCADDGATFTVTPWDIMLTEYKRPGRQVADWCEATATLFRFERVARNQDLTCQAGEDLVYCPNCFDHANNYGHLKVTFDEGACILLAQDCDCAVTDEQLDALARDEQQRRIDDSYLD